MAKRVVNVDNKEFEIAYDILNLDKKETIIFLHGWGSSKEVMKVFKDSFRNFKHIYLDMPGFGSSETDEILTTHKYANIVDKFLEELEIKKDVVVGHSFGGKVATLLNPDKLILLSSAGILEEKSFKVKMKIKLFKILKVFGLSKFRNMFVSEDAKGMKENMYQTFKNVVDEDFRDEFAKYKGESVVFWGKDDKAVSVESGEKISTLLGAKFYVLDGDHFFFLDKVKEIEEKI